MEVAFHVACRAVGSIYGQAVLQRVSGRETKTALHTQTDEHTQVGERRQRAHRLD